MLQANLYKAFLEGLSARIIVCRDYEEALKAYQVALYAYNAQISLKKPLLCKEIRLHTGDDVRSFFVELVENLAQLRTFYTDENTIVIAPLCSLLYPLPSHKYCQSLTLEVGKDYQLQMLKDTLIRYGYESVEMIEMEGEVSFRGDIVDIYPPLSKPYRISFFGDECEGISIFSIETQLKEPTSQSALDIAPALFSLEQDEYESLCEAVEMSDYGVMSKDILSIGLWYLPHRWLLPAHYPTMLTKAAALELGEIGSLGIGDGCATSDVDSSAREFWVQVLVHIAESKQDSPQMPVVLEELESYIDMDFYLDKLEKLLAHHAGKRVTLVVRSRSELAALNAGIVDSSSIVESSAVVHISTPDELIISLESSIPQVQKRPKRPKFALNELNIGEYVVHSEYGIGIFKGIVQNTILGITRDFIHIQYFGEDKLLLPVENLHTIDRYIAANGSIPVIDRLGKGSFARLKQKAREKLFAIADSIIKLAATRNLLQGVVIDTQSPDLEVFKHTAGFALTPDQAASIESIFSDLASGRVMDRLLSGDVGFGKTEVAMNAIYAVCQSGYQCALIVPTTLLSAQHFATLSKRFAPFGIQVGKYDRYLSAKEKRETLERLKSGALDVVVGTHSLFGVEFARLGLIVVDEEHKFGVKQKESLKQLSTNVHILSMSATPIPRTLNMALSHIKGMSRLETPPTSRKDPRTFIKHKSDALLQEIIQRELRRGGQVFYLYNNIASMPAIYSHLHKLFPTLSIAMLHSRISASQSEQIMYEFACGKHQILLCTAIIESGIHLPNANTIIVDGADRFGLADLHQLRGRVGRGDKEGLCYFLIESMESITQDASKRLLALERNSYLGSGASIAYHDLEIRGGGNLIGESQSGHIKNIGFSLYLKLLEDALATLSNQPSLMEHSVELRLNISAYLSPDLITSDSLRLELYRRLSLAKEVREVIDIEAEICDRFGALDTLSQTFIQLIIIKILANHKRIKSILHFGQNIQITLESLEKHTIKAASADDECVLEALLAYLRS